MHPEKPSDPPRAHIETAAGRLSYTDEGSGPTLLMIHGLPGSVRDFRWLAPALPEFRIVRLDLPGFGESERSGATGMPVPNRANVVRAFIAALDLPPSIVVSHSAGGFVAAHLARRYPDLVRGLAFIASPGPVPHYQVGIYQPVKLGFRIPPARPLLHRLQRRFYRALGFPSRLSDRDRMYSTLDAASHDFPLHRDNLARIVQPALIAWASDDRMIPPRCFEALENAAPGGPRLRFDDGGHNIQKTRASAIADGIRELQDLA